MFKIRFRLTSLQAKHKVLNIKIMNRSFSQFKATWRGGLIINWGLPVTRLMGLYINLGEGA